MPKLDAEVKRDQCQSCYQDARSGWVTHNVNLKQQSRVSARRLIRGPNVAFSWGWTFTLTESVSYINIDSFRFFLLTCHSTCSVRGERVWLGVIFLFRHSSVILLTGVELSVSCNLLDTRYISLDDTSYHRSEFYLTAYYRAALPYKLYIRPVIRILNILYYHDSGLDLSKSHARYDRNSRI
jgi:hypothetical protein